MVPDGDRPTAPASGAGRGGPDLVAELLALAVELAAAAGALLLDGLGAVRQVTTKSTTTDMVTEWDARAEARIVDGIRRRRPDDALLGEEGTVVEGTTGVRWIIDPLDGTTNFLYGMPGFGVSIAAEVDGLVVAGAVADPLHAELFSAVAGGGARCNGESIVVSACESLGSALASTGFSYQPARRRAQAEVLSKVLPEIRDIRRHGAAAVDLCWLACGRVDAFWERGLSHWDYAAGALIASEAGASVDDLRGGAPSTEVVFGATPAIAADLAALLLDSGADRA